MTARTAVVVDDVDDWPLSFPGVEVVSAREYLTAQPWAEARGVRVYNLCRSYRYQKSGYYVSLLAAARKHRPFPGLHTVLEMRNRTIVRTADDELDELVQKSLARIKSDRFALSIYFGHNLSSSYDRLSARLFQMFPAPVLRAHFARGDERWRLTSVGPISTRDLPESHHAFIEQAAADYFSKPRYRKRVKRAPRYQLAVLRDPAEVLAPSDPRALKRFERAAEREGFGVELITKDDYGRLAEFDALFIRETTAINHHTFRFAQRAAVEGLPVIDDPLSILRCTNKVFLQEALEEADVPTPRTFITDNADADEIERRVGFPCVLKYPDSSFSQGVLKCSDADDVRAHGTAILEQSDLLLAQEFLPSDFDWRIGVLAGEALYACRYHMVKGHWQVVRKTGDKAPPRAPDAAPEAKKPSKYRYGKVEPVELSHVPRRVLKIAVKAAKAMGDSLYGVDLKQVGRRIVVMEVNDNPNLDAGCEDAVLGDELYARIARVLLRRIEATKERS
jgi:glutathione synthase/RimK-type ligase-like ATP-grasp enzyme